MLKLVVCVKQVPRVTELPWDEKPERSDVSLPPA